MHDVLFRKPAALEEGDLMSDAVAIGLDDKTFGSCMDHPPVDRVTHDAALAESFGLRATPSFIVGRLDGDILRATAIFVGARPLDDFARSLDQALHTR
jgi:protein-disulfide isomerase